MSRLWSTQAPHSQYSKPANPIRSDVLDTPFQRFMTGRTGRIWSREQACSVAIRQNALHAECVLGPSKAHPSSSYVGSSNYTAVRSLR